MPVIQLFPLLFLLLFPGFAGAGNDAAGYVRVTVEYTSMFPGKLQVLDNVCRESRSIECAKASIKIQSEPCRQNPQQTECKEAQSLLDTSFCTEGLVHEGRISPGGKVSVRLCVSEGGFGNMSVRDIKKGSVWTSYVLLSDGQTITYP